MTQPGEQEPQPDLSTAILELGMTEVPMYGDRGRAIQQGYSNPIIERVMELRAQGIERAGTEYAVIARFERPDVENARGEGTTIPFGFFLTTNLFSGLHRMGLKPSVNIILYDNEMVAPFSMQDPDVIPDVKLLIDAVPQGGEGDSPPTTLYHVALLPITRPE
ncbi:MAG TPA: hypothetical protein VFB59_03490 [Candidatus Saccharimonadales bacterium]|nr:hypothetical protein [Candidatus Saccharimonadales bacterium]